MRPPQTSELYLNVAVPSPLRATFDYLPPAIGEPRPGMRVRVPFGRRETVGVIVGVSRTSDIPRERLKPAIALLDTEPALEDAILRLYLWASDYYQYPVGQALQASLPKPVREGKALKPPGPRLWRLTPQGRQTGEKELARAPQQQKVFRLLHDYGELGSDELHVLCESVPAPFLKALRDKGLAETFEPAPDRGVPCDAPLYGSDAPLPLNAEQQAAVDGIELDGFSAHLLEGVTGSGKTEVYLQLIARALEDGRQVLVLVPEIGLTPQTIGRFKRRFRRSVVALHSGLTDTERFQAWLQARAGDADIVIGTRSAIFTPLARPGLIIVDEEHDYSYKQQEGFRYSARDLSLVRGRLQSIPVLLGSATPSLESLHNALAGRYQLHRLERRAGTAASPAYRFLDLRGERLEEGFSGALLSEIGWHLEAGNQALVFLNRRGFAPVLQCHDCGWIAACPRCETGYTLHRDPASLRCHHCGAQKSLPPHCPECTDGELRPIGLGTERSEQVLTRHFPEVPVLRVDRDSTRGKDSLGQILERVNSGAPCILVGTQMLAKGHHFPGVTLVAVLDADSGLFSPDFRGQEQMGQLLVQVAGRAGRGDNPGEVLIQTHHLTHPMLNALVREGYDVFARRLLDERRQAGLPPHAHLALLRAEATGRRAPEDFLAAAAHLGGRRRGAGVELLGPMPSPMEKRAGKFRYQLLLQSPSRAPLHRLVRGLIAELENHPLARRVRWSVDIDPLDLS